MYSYTYNGDGLRMTKSHSLTVTQYTWDIGVEAGLPLLLQDNAGSYIYGPGGHTWFQQLGIISNQLDTEICSSHLD
jgi:hypothetical protein